MRGSSISNGAGEKRANRDSAVRPLTGFSPIKAVLLTRIGENFGRVLIGMRGAIFLFGDDEFLANAHGGHFILANAAEQDFVFGGIGVEKPGIALVNEGNGSRPVHGANVEGGGAVGLFHEAMQFLIFLNEVSAILGVFGFVAGGDELLGV